MSRYDHLLELIDQYKPRTICEIGVWNGANAIRMINRALKHHQTIQYTGFDLFEDATAETDATEFNVKGHNQMRAVAKYIRSETRLALEASRGDMEGSHGASINLIKGNTRQTLPPTVADFVFLDGGHSIETIRSDYERVCGSAVVVLDDYYTPDASGGCPDVTKYGCNFLWNTYDTGSGRIGEIDVSKITVLPTKDPVRGGGYTQLVAVCKA